MSAISTAPYKVLLYCPTYYQKGGALAVRKRTMESIDALRWDGELTVVYGTHKLDPSAEKGANILANYRKGRATCLDGGFDAMLSVEHDMVVPEDALMKMWDIGQPVVYGVYVMRHGPPRLSAWSCKYGRMGRPIDLYPDELREAIENVIHPVSGVGFGCTLFRREILEQFEFHGDGPQYGQTPDRPFANDLVDAGVQQYAHFGAACGHILPTGETVWPSWVADKESEKDLMANKTAVYVALESFSGQVGMRHMQFNRGDFYELDQYRASSYVREGLLKRVEVEKVEPVEAPEPKIEQKRVRRKSPAKAKKSEPEDEPEPEE